MWAIDNRTPYAAEGTWIRDLDGAEIWVVGVKATYDILPDGSTRLAEQQLPLHTGPVPHDGLQSLRYETDLGPSKPATDIILIGHAHAQTAEPVSMLPVGFRVGALTRTAHVWGDRYWQDGMLFQSASAPIPFHRMPLVYERAFGGDATDLAGASGNPVGRGIVADLAGRRWLPNIESADQPIRTPGDRPPVVGFGVIASHWPERRQYAGTYDQAWRDERFPLLPADLDPRHWQIAPPAQQVPGHLKGGEPIVLANLTPPGLAPGGRLGFVLPKLTLAFETRFLDGSRQASRAVIHSVILEPDHPRLSVVYHMALPCHPKVNLLQFTRITQKQRPLDRTRDDITDTLAWPETVI